MEYKKLLEDANQNKMHPIRYTETIDGETKSLVGMAQYFGPGFIQVFESSPNMTSVFGTNMSDVSSDDISDLKMRISILRTYKDVEFIDMLEFCDELGFERPTNNEGD